MEARIPRAAQKASISHFFKVRPLSCSLQPMEGVQLEVTFCPLWLSSVHAQLLLTTDTGAVKTVHLRGSCQYCLVNVEPDSVDLQACHAGVLCQREVRLVNQGQQIVQYSVLDTQDLTEATMRHFDSDVLYVSPLRGSVQPNDAAILNLCYAPAAVPGDFSRFFQIQMPGEVPLQVQVFGQVLNQQVQLDLPTAGDHRRPLSNTDADSQVNIALCE